jgi:hypothetical protein
MAKKDKPTREKKKPKKAKPKPPKPVQEKLPLTGGEGVL